MHFFSCSAEIIFYFKKEAWMLHYSGSLFSATLVSEGTLMKNSSDDDKSFYVVSSSAASAWGRRRRSLRSRGRAAPRMRRPGERTTPTETKWRTTGG